MSSQAASFSLDKYTEDGFLSTILRYGLFLGALFQLFCIGSAILLPAPADSPDLTDIDGSEEQKHSGNIGNDMSRRLHKLRKQEKKKRR